MFWSIIILFHLWIIWIVLRDLSNLFCITAKGCRANWFRQSGGTPEVVGSIPGRGEFPPPVKKTPSPASCPKHCGARPNSQGDGPPCTGGAGVRGFSWPAVRRSFYLSKNAVGAVLPPAGQVLLYALDDFCHIHVDLYLLYQYTEFTGFPILLGTDRFQF